MPVYSSRADHIVNPAPTDAVRPLQSDEIEILNAHGPYNHANWIGRDVAVTSEEALAGRADLLSRLIRDAILKRYSVDELSTKTIADVGCYDGFVLHQLSDLPFHHLVGFEPRAKNIAKGETVRNVLGIATRCEFRQSKLADIEETFDIVICTGLLHHLTAPAAGIDKLRAICREFIFIETLVLPDSLVTPDIRAKMELKDLPYFSGESFVGLSGHKVESGYLDGSAADLSIVTLPSVSTLVKYLEQSGFEQIKTPLGSEEYTEQVSRAGHRPFSAICITAEAGLVNDRMVSAMISEYETGMLRTLLDRDTVRELFEKIVIGKATALMTPLARATLSYIASDQPVDAIESIAPDRFTYEILKNMKFSSVDKVTLEFAKVLHREGQIVECVQLLRSITQSLNADWRSTFRAFALLSICSEELDDVECARYRALCLRANPQFPETLLSR